MAGQHDRQRIAAIGCADRAGRGGLAQQWVQPDADGKINVSFGLDHEVDDLEIRAWLNHAEKLAVDTFALVPSRGRPRG